MIRAVLCDIEGTTTELSFVHDVLFPYAAARLPAWVEANAGRPEVAAVEQEIGARGPKAVTAALLSWMAQDRKVTSLKAIQGLIWEEGYVAGQLHAHVFPDVAPALQRWAAAGLTLAVYSSGSVHAQQLLFGNTIAGDLRPLFRAWFDTTTGPKREADSYTKIADTLDLRPDEILFLSDVSAELDAATRAGLRVRWVVRSGSVEAGSASSIASFSEVDLNETAQD